MTIDEFQINTATAKNRKVKIRIGLSYLDGKTKLPVPFGWKN
jgi:hypothetical protein